MIKRFCDICEKEIKNWTNCQPILRGDICRKCAPVFRKELDKAIERTRELRVLSRGIEKDLRRLENENRDRKDLIIREITVLKAVRIEIRQRERMAFFSEFGIQ